jgi:hypothetical protein
LADTSDTVAVFIEAACGASVTDLTLPTGYAPLDELLRQYSKDA